MNCWVVELRPSGQVCFIRFAINNLIEVIHFYSEGSEAISFSLYVQKLPRSSQWFIFVIVIQFFVNCQRCRSIALNRCFVISTEFSFCYFERFPFLSFDWFHFWHFERITFLSFDWIPFLSFRPVSLFVISTGVEKSKKRFEIGAVSLFK